MIKEIYGKKIGMTQVFSPEGNLLAVTLLEVEPVCLLEQVTYPTKSSVRIGCFKLNSKKASKLKKPLAGYFSKLGVEAYKLIREVPGQLDSAKTPDQDNQAEDKNPKQAEGSKDSKAAENSEAAKDSKETKAPEETKDSKETEDSQESQTKDSTVGVNFFKEGDLVDVQAKTKGKGFAGGMKRHGWSGQRKSHGSTSHRRIGSSGASAYPSRIIKGLNMPGHMGNRFRTTKNLKVLKVDPEKNIIFLSGSVPGARGAVVRLRKVS